mmetsp:Transcript_113062/g.324959  ORF Transcript_113062/g.324959 Transcript_113062/m.324959 type:complete len:255 (+) Transcript_113062:1442-2206(+)
MSLGTIFAAGIVQENTPSNNECGSLVIAGACFARAGVDMIARSLARMPAVSRQTASSLPLEMARCLRSDFAHATCRRVLRNASESESASSAATDATKAPAGTEGKSQAASTSSATVCRRTLLSTSLGFWPKATPPARCATVAMAAISCSAAFSSAEMFWKSLWRSAKDAGGPPRALVWTNALQSPPPPRRRRCSLLPLMLRRAASLPACANFPVAGMAARFCRSRTVPSTKSSLTTDTSGVATHTDFARKRRCK